MSIHSSHIFFYGKIKISFVPLPFPTQGIKLKIESSIETIETSSIDQLEKANEEVDEVSLCDS